MKWRLYEGYFRKEIARGRGVDAFRMYQSMSVRPLLAVLGMAYRPARWDFELRYIHEEFPPQIAEAVLRLCYVASPEELEGKHAEATVLFERTIARIVCVSLS